ncbi:phosphotyrosine protein phosphatase [Nocardia jinanensis]|uniref:Phosphotyrosine protein phosphatase n=1 Tax=Nocardia jinanensis TaxID=382504 RepID=A0A917RHG1_9NOCA|nr:phosphotyrosine protein phosphatase [Nocardia jinanensis]
MRISGGGTTKHGVLLRSAQLSRLDDAGHTALRELGVGAVHDLRGHREIERAGADRLPAEIRSRITPFDDGSVTAPPHEAGANRQNAPGAALAYMMDVYRNFPARPEAHAAITALAEAIVADRGAVLVHCAAGKDRTGWTIATLLRAVGVGESEILGDYMLSNQAVAELRTSLKDELGADLPQAVLEVREEYLRAGLESGIELHGDFESYLTAVGLTPDLRDRLRERLLA